MTRNKQLSVIILIWAISTAAICFFMFGNNKEKDNDDYENQQQHHTTNEVGETGEDGESDGLTYGLADGREGFIQSYLAESGLWRPNKKALVMRSGESDTIECTFNTMPTEVVWKSEDDSIAKITNSSQSGGVKAIAKGSTYVAAYFEGRKVLKVPVHVDRETLPPLSEIEKSRFKMVDGVYVNPNAKKTDKATIMMAGDLMFVSEQQRFAYQDGTFNFNPSFEYVRDLMKSADFSIGNFETVTDSSKPYKWEQTKVYPGFGSDLVPNCNAPVTSMDAVRYGGFDAVFTANNHCLDLGLPSLLETAKSLERYNILYTGTFADENTPRYMMLDLNGIKVAILSYTTYLNLWDFGQTKEEVLLHTNHYTQDTAERTRSDIAHAKQNGAEYVIVSMHWGFVNTFSPSRKMENIAQDVADMGADYIFGHHSHTIHRHELLTAADGRTVPVVFSAGNFVHSMNTAKNKRNRDGIVIQIELERDSNGAVTAKQGYIPLFSERNFRGERYVTLPVDPELNGGYTSKRLTKSDARIRKALGEDIPKVEH